MGEIIALEGISGSGKSSLIDGIELEDSIAVEWFDNELIIHWANTIEIFTMH